MIKRRKHDCSQLDVLIKNTRPALVLFAVLSVTFTFAWAQKTVPAITANRRVDQLLSEMTLDEKITLLHGTDEPNNTFQGEAGYMPGIPRLGIPALRLADGPPGILTRVPSVAPTSTMGLAATFSRADAERNGELIGREAKSHGVDIALQPFLNINRDITFKRSYNTFGEDPFLTGQIGAAEIRGIQSQGIMAQAKHYIGYDTAGNDVYIDDQTLHEVYMAPFADASDAGVSSIMCSYNKVNGLYACGNAGILIQDLRTEIGFKGFITSDWGATHATDFIAAGLDMEMPGPLRTPTTGPSYFETDYPVMPRPPSNAAKDSGTILEGLPEEPKSLPWIFPTVLRPAFNLKSAVLSGSVSEEDVTRAAGRVLCQMDRFGLLDGHSKHTVTPSAVEENAKVVEKTGEDAAVLLKNEDAVLPLKEDDLRSIAFIGPGAGQTIAVGMAGEKAVGLPAREIGTVTALRALVGASHPLHLLYAVANDMDGTPIPVRFLSHDGSPGLQRAVSGSDLLEVDPNLDFTIKNGKALPANSSETWNGQLTIPSTGTYRIHLQMLGCYATLRIDGKKVAENGRMWIHGDITQAGQDNVLPTTDGLDNIRIDQTLAAGPHTLSVSTTPDTSNSPVQIRLNWVTPGQQKADYSAAIEAAKRSKTAVVFVWSRGRPDFTLPGDQNRLIEDIAKVNSNTIVVLNVGQPISMPWLGKVRAVLQMWWPGDEGGWATANLLLGKVSPAGRLPVTWPRRLEDTPANDPAHPERSGKGVGGKTTFSEGVFVGYRWFDQKGIEPLFPFGYGLSYAKFEYLGLRITHAEDGGLDVNFQVKNLSDVASDEVPQVYLGAPTARPQGVQFAVRGLAAFDRIHLAGGQSQAVSLHIAVRRLQYWSAETQNWKTPPGSRVVSVGGSSKDFRLHAEITP